MTNEEAINVINTWILPMRETLKGTLAHEFLDAVDTLRKQAIKQATSDKTSDKYAWHDLRKNPDDLPEWGRLFVYCFMFRDEGKGEHLYNIDNAHGIVVDFMKNRGNSIAECIAWKYVEPFKEE